MKKIVILALVALCLLPLTACDRTEERVEAVSETFLNAYYTAEYDKAAACCTPALAAQVAKGARAQALVPELAEKMKEAVRSTSFKIVSIAVDKDAARATVRYDLLVPGLDKPVPKALQLQLEGRTALVDRIE